VLVGGTVQLSCVTGYSAPPADVSWTHDAAVSTTGRQAVAEFGSRRDGGASARLSASLVLDAVDLQDAGLYECLAVNPLSGQAVRSLGAYVNVTGRLQHRLASEVVILRRFRTSFTPPNLFVCFGAIRMSRLCYGHDVRSSVSR